jgi:lipid II:glycine glycyltransferase (peptidoglycan interpeptide bridge formation enzyme)
MENNNQNHDFLQSPEWAAFQKATGKKIFSLETENFSASLIAHELPIVGEYVYCPRGPVFSADAEKISNFQFPISKLIDLAKKENAGWIRIEPENEEILEEIKKYVTEKIAKAPHDMQPKENFVVDIAKPIEQLLAEMKSKTRYNIGIAQKKRSESIFLREK